MIPENNLTNNGINITHDHIQVSSQPGGGSNSKSSSSLPAVRKSLDPQIKFVRKGKPKKDKILRQIFQEPMEQQNPSGDKDVEAYSNMQNQSVSSIVKQKKLPQKTLNIQPKKSIYEIRVEKRKRTKHADELKKERPSMYKTIEKESEKSEEKPKVRGNLTIPFTSANGVSFMQYMLQLLTEQQLNDEASEVKFILYMPIQLKGSKVSKRSKKIKDGSS